MIPGDTIHAYKPYDIISLSKEIISYISYIMAIHAANHSHYYYYYYF